MELGEILSDALICRGFVFISGEFENIDHSKRFIVIGENEKEYVGYFFINSNLSKYVSSRPDFMNMQMFIKHSDYPYFLDYDSFIGCHELSKIPKSKLSEQIKNKKTRYVGALNENDLALLMENLRNSKLYSKKEKDTFFR